MLVALRPVIHGTYPNSSRDVFHQHVGQVIATQRQKLNIIFTGVSYDQNLHSIVLGSVTTLHPVF